MGQRLAKYCLSALLLTSGCALREGRVIEKIFVPRRAYVQIDPLTLEGPEGIFRGKTPTKIYSPEKYIIVIEELNKRSSPKRAAFYLHDRDYFNRIEKNDFFKFDSEIADRYPRQEIEMRMSEGEFLGFLRGLK